LKLLLSRFKSLIIREFSPLSCWWHYLLFVQCLLHFFPQLLGNLRVSYEMILLQNECVEVSGFVYASNSFCRHSKFNLSVKDFAVIGFCLNIGFEGPSCPSF